ncbi:1065_t:CDS:2, partial [Dentiscutata heterogama]
LIILAFAHSFHLLLRTSSDMASDGASYNASGMGGVEENDQSVNAESNNIFSTFGDAVLATYAMLIVHVNELRNLVQIIQNDKWNGFEKLYLSPAILKVIKVEYDNFSKNKQVEIKIENTVPIYRYKET